MIKILQENWKIFLLASLTLGLAPFNPPHILGKLKWIFGGNAFNGEHAMQFIDWFDLAMHGTPWVLLIVSLLLNLKSKLSSLSEIKKGKN